MLVRAILTRNEEKFVKARRVVLEAGLGAPCPLPAEARSVAQLSSRSLLR
jgi:hypothetical protein